MQFVLAGERFCVYFAFKKQNIFSLSLLIQFSGLCQSTFAYLVNCQLRFPVYRCDTRVIYLSIMIECNKCWSAICFAMRHRTRNLYTTTVENSCTNNDELTVVA